MEVCLDGVRTILCVVSLSYVMHAMYIHSTLPCHTDLEVGRANRTSIRLRTIFQCMHVMPLIRIIPKKHIETG